MERNVAKWIERGERQKRAAGDKFDMTFDEMRYFLDRVHKSSIITQEVCDVIIDVYHFGFAQGRRAIKPMY